MFQFKFVFLSLLVILCSIQIDQGTCAKFGSRASRPARRPATSRPYTRAPTHRPYTHAPTYRPQPAPTYRPQPAPTYRPQPAPTSRPYTHSPTYRPQPAPTYRAPTPGRNPTYRPATQPGRYPTQPGKYPTQPQRYPQGPPSYQSGGYRPNNQANYQSRLQIPQPGGKTKIKVYNINNYHSPGYFAPMSYTPYHYSSRDTGSGVLGFFLGYSLAKMTSPSFYHCHSCYSGYSPRYDHYTVHHYYHNSGTVPKEQKVTTNNIITCGDSSQICPTNTVTLCTANGQVMCVVAVSNTVPCKDNPNLKCAQSSVPCVNNETAECKNVPKGQSTTVNIPCISNTIIEGNITTVNNTIVSSDPPKNTTAEIENLTTVSSVGSSDTFPSLGAENITTTPPPTNRAKRETAQAQPYCVTILAEPSVRQPTEGEIVFNEVTNVFDQFVAKAFGIDDSKKKNKK